MAGYKRLQLELYEKKMNKTFSGNEKVKALEAAGCGERSDLKDANQRAGGQTGKKRETAEQGVEQTLVLSCKYPNPHR